MKILSICTLSMILVSSPILSAKTDMSAHNKRYDYRDEIKMPLVASNIQDLLGVPRKNWSTFGDKFTECPKLDEWAKEEQEYFESQNSRKSKKYLTDNKGNSYTLEESNIETVFYSCLSKIRFIKNQVSENKIYRKLIVEVDFARLIKKHSGFNKPKFTLNTMIRKNVNDGVPPDRNDIYFIDMYGNRYVILQMVESNAALFYDTKGRWPSIYFIGASGRPLKEKMPINYAADYYTYEGVYKYKNRNGFDRQAYIIRGHLDPEFRNNTLSYFYTKQWVDDNVNVEGM